MSAEDVPDMIKDMQGRLAGHKEPATGGLIFRAPELVRREPDPPELIWPTVASPITFPISFKNQDELYAYIKEHVHKALDELAEEERTHKGLRPFPMAEGEG